MSESNYELREFLSFIFATEMDDSISETAKITNIVARANQIMFELMDEDERDE